MEGYSDLITQKIDELIALAREEGEVNVQIILNTLSGARRSKMDGNLAAYVQKYVVDVLLPQLKAYKENQQASQN